MSIAIPTDWLDHIRALVLNWSEEFTAADLATTVEHQLAPEVFDWSRLKGSPLSHGEILRKQDQWRLDHPGTSTGNMRRICEKLVAEGVLTRRQKVQGYHTWNYYKRAGSDRLLETK